MSGGSLYGVVDPIMLVRMHVQTRNAVSNQPTSSGLVGTNMLHAHVILRSCC
jgi:hypothetical protein